ncbi:hypothetical protein OR1_01570 [Geobacter sp. OR-1]|uniref:DUF3443 domain-containing protein n=1 Tax=Geobacter sp. OR-1 TaxID=1266765 RepID=UPI000541D5DE|nr:DUF3443 domain-containing protein [Geobacter sp. OR-1]GAM09295.1 hypothetical protein OR1_01570 [Geobacter sp. OR-1]
MKSDKFLIPLVLMALISGCGGSDGTKSSASSSTSTMSNFSSNTTSTGGSTTANGGSGTSGGSGSTTTGNGSNTGDSTTGSNSTQNILTVTVNGSLCSASTSGSYVNKPCVSVTVCSPGSSACQTVNDILLDTGSYGLRIFESALPSVSLTPVASGSGSLAECVQFGDGSSLWGPVRMADVVLGGEPRVQVPIQVINASFGSVPASCYNADSDPVAAGYNGILGVGLFAEDCGSDCTGTAGNGMYFSCSGTSCGGASAPLVKQVTNPVARLPEDNNGVIVQLPAVSAGGTRSVNGSLVLGIGTKANNTPAAVTRYQANQYAEFYTSFQGTTYSSFIDTGSNGLFFTSQSSLVPDCGSHYYSGWFCPASTVSLSAVNKGYTGSPSGTVYFSVGNASYLFSTDNSVFSELGGSMAGGFDWGLPFFLGRTVYVGINGTSSSLGTGPYWAY